MALYFYFNETTGDLVYSDKAAYDAEGYASLGEQTNMSPMVSSSWVFDARRSDVKTVSKDPAVYGRIAGLMKMNSMFNGCSSLAILDLSGFDTSKVNAMDNMFNGCTSFTSLDLSGFDTSQVTSMSGMFNGCSSLTNLDLSGFDTSKVVGMAYMFYGCPLDIVRCRPKQFYESSVFQIPSSTGKWYDYKGDEVTDFTSDAATSLYSDPSKAPDGSKLVNLQDLKAALETMGGGLPFTEDTVIAEIEGEPVWSYAADASSGDGAPGFIGRIARDGSWAATALMCGLLQLGGDLPIGDSGNKQMGIGMMLTSNGPVMSFTYGNKTAGLAYKDGMPILPAMGETEPVMAGDHPYGFATYATDSDFMDYITQTE